MNFMKVGALIVGVVMISGAATGYQRVKKTTRKKTAQIVSCKGMVNEGQCALRRAMDYLWAEHVLWTRQYIVSAIAGLDDLDAATQRLLKNQDDIGNSIVPYYGPKAGAKLSKLLKDHILIAADIVKAAIAKQNDQVKMLDVKWHDNAKEIAEFLSSANPNWPQEALVTMLNEHLDLTTKELMARLKGDWKTDAMVFDKVFKQSQMMGQDLANGIIKQFPDKF